MAQIDKVPMQSYTTQRGNTIYYGGAKGVSDDGSRKGAVGAVAFDKGSDGTIDAGLVAAAGMGPRGAAAGVAGFGPNHAGAGAIATNGELVQTWKRYV